MASLISTLEDSGKRKSLVADCVIVIDEEVKSKGGISGVAIKTAYKLVKGIKPTFVPEAVESLIDDFAKNLQPLADKAEAAGSSVPAYFNAHRSEVADAMLAITDVRAQRSRHGTAKSGYEKLRPSAKKHVEEAVPRVSVLIEKYTRS